MAAPTPEDLHEDSGIVGMILLCAAATAIAAPLIVIWALVKRKRLRDISDDVWFWPAKLVFAGVVIVPIVVMLFVPIALINLAGMVIFQRTWFLPFVIPLSAVYVIVLGRWVWKE